MADNTFLSVLLQLHAIVEIDNHGNIKGVNIVQAESGQVVRAKNGTPIVPPDLREAHGQLILKHENPIIRRILQAASLNAMPKGSELEIVAQHLEERSPDMLGNHCQTTTEDQRHGIYPVNGHEPPDGDDSTRN
jgi:hypothetical protein